MCLSVPSKIISIDEHNNAIVEAFGVQKKVCLDLMSEDVDVGDYILIHVGVAMSKIDAEQAQISLKAYEELLKMEDDELH